MLYFYFFLIVLLIAGSIFYALWFKDYFHPLVIMYVPVGFSLLIFYSYFVSQGYSVSDYVIGLYAYSMLSFFVGALPMLVANKGRGGTFTAVKRNASELRPISKKITFFLLFVGTIGFVLNAYEASLVALDGGANWAVNLRRATSILNVEYSGRHLVIFLWLGVAILAFYRRVWKISVSLLLFFVCLWLLNSLVTMGRTETLMAIFVPLIASFYAQKYHFQQSPSVYPLVIALAVFGFGFYVIGLITAKISGSAVETFMAYFSYQLINIDKFALTKAGSYSGDTIFYIYKVMWQGITGENSFSGNEIVLGTFQKYNLFGAFGRVFLDFGAFGAQIFWLLLGFSVSLLHNMVRKGNVYYIVFYAFFSQALMLAFYGGAFLRLATWYYIAILLLFVFILSKIRIFSHNRRYTAPEMSGHLVT